MEDTTNSNSTAVLSGDALINALNAEVTDTTTNDIIATFISNYTQMLTRKIGEAQFSGTDVAISSDEVSALLISAAETHGVTSGAAVIQDLMNDPVVSGAINSLVSNPAADIVQADDSLLKDFDTRLAEVTAQEPVTAEGPGAFLTQDIATANNINGAIDSLKLGAGLLFDAGSGLNKEIKSIQSGLAGIEYNNLVGIIKDGQTDKLFRDIAFDKLVDEHTGFNDLLTIAKDPSIDIEYREAAFSKLQTDYGQIDSTGKYSIGESVDIFGAVAGLGAGAASIGGGVYSLVTSSQLAAEASGQAKAQSILSATGGGVSVIKGIYTVTDTIATQVAKRTGSEGVKQVSGFLSSSATKAAGGLTSGATPLTKAASGFAIGIGSALAVAAGVTSITLNALKADEARKSGNAGRAAIYGIQAGLDGVGLVLDVVSLVADFLPPIGTVVSAVLDIINLGIAGINTILGFFAELVDTRTDEQKTQQAFDALVDSAEFQIHVDELASSFKDEGYDVLEYIVDADSTNTTEGDVDGTAIDRTLTRYLTDQALALQADNDARLAIIDASSIGRTLVGGNKDDYISGGAGDDVIYGGKGNDILLGGVGSDALFGGDGDDTLVAGTGNDSLFGEGGDDSLYAGAGVNRLFGGPGNDRLRVTPGVNDIADGGPDDDTLILAELETAIYDRPAEAILQIRYPLSGSSSSIGFPPSTGENGTVSRWFEDARAEINLSEGKGYLRMTADYRQLEQTGAIDDYFFTGFAGPNPTKAPDHVDDIYRAILGGNTGDWEYLGSDITPYLASDNLQILYTDYSNGKQTWVTDGTNVFVAHRDITSNFDDSNPQVYTSWRKSPVTAADLLAGYNDNTIENGRSDDHENSVTLTAAELLGLIIHSGYVGTDLENIETVIAPYLDPDGSAVSANAFNDTVTIVGSDKTEVFQVDINSTVEAGAGDDTLILNGNTSDQFDADRFRIDGGAGNDTVSFDGVDGATVTLIDASTDVTSLQGYIRGVENVIGTDSADTITGNSASNILIGGNGADHLIGGAGDDVLAGGNGNDTLDGSVGIDTVNYSLDDGDNDGKKRRIDLRSGRTEWLNTDNQWVLEDTLVNIENVYGSAQDDKIYGGEGNNVLAGDAGNDFIIGGSGNDILLGGAGDDFLGGDNEETEVGSGNDIFSGGQGRDNIAGFEGIDTVSYSLDSYDAERRHKVALSEDEWDNSVTYIDEGDGWKVNDLLSNIENIVGGNKADDLTGNGFANTINGAGGNDVVNGAGGDDTLTFSSGQDDLNGGTGTDTLQFAQTGETFFADLQTGTASNGSSYSTRKRIDAYAIGDLIAGQEVTLELTLADGRVVTASYILNTTAPAWRWATLLNEAANNSPELSPYIQGTTGFSGYLEFVTQVNEGESGSLRLLADGQDQSSIFRDISSHDLPASAGTATLSSLENIDASGADRHVTLKGDENTNILKGGSGHDLLDGRDGADQLSGGAGDDLLLGGTGNDLLLGGEGRDTLEGGTGVDVLSGGEGNDLLKGESGNDVLFANGGVDLLEGGADDDTYVIFSNSYQSLIRDDKGRHTLQFNDLSRDQVDVSFSLKEGRSLLNFSSTAGWTLASVDLGDASVLAGLSAAVAEGAQALNTEIDEVFGHFAAVRFGDEQLTQDTLTSLFTEAASQPGIFSEEALSTGSSYSEAIQEVDDHYVYESGIKYIDDAGGFDTLALEGVENALFYRDSNSADTSYGDLTIFNLDGGSGDLLRRNEDVTIRDYFAVEGGRDTGAIEAIEVNSVSYSPAEVDKLVAATAQFMAEQGIDSVYSSDAGQYVDQLSSITASALA